MPEEFKKGDVVRLKSGGPRMTISSVEDDGRFFCLWFDGNDQKQKIFDGAVLMRMEPPSP